MIKFGFVTAVQLGLTCMEAIYRSGGELSLAISLPDNQAVKKSGRIFLDEFCSSNNIPLIKSLNVNDIQVVEAIKEANLDWLFIIGWSQIAGKSILSAPKRGVLGMHPTLLPEGRGRASIPWAILKGLNKTGVTLFKMDLGIDTGDIVSRIIIPLTNHISATQLYSEVNKAHADLILEVMPKLMNDCLTLSKQEESIATEWPLRRPEDGEINLAGSVWDAEKLVRALTKPYPGAFYYVKEKKYLVWKARVEIQQMDRNVPHLKFKDGFLLILEGELC